MIVKIYCLFAKPITILFKNVLTIKKNEQMIFLENIDKEVSLYKYNRTELFSYKSVKVTHKGTGESHVFNALECYCDTFQNPVYLKVQTKDGWKFLDVVEFIIEIVQFVKTNRTFFEKVIDFFRSLKRKRK